MASLGLAFPAIRRSPVRFHSNQSSSQSREGPLLEYRTLGRTGLKITTVSYGAMRTRDPAIIHRALDYGINYIDTAHSYMDGYNEVVVGKVLQKRRKETFIATKVHIDGVEKMMASVEASLKSLQTDYLDVIQLHSMKSVEHIRDERAMEALQRMKGEGKARFIGFTTHRNEAALLREAAKMDFYDMILVTYNFKSPDDLTDAIQEAAKTGIGIVAMKTQAGGYKRHEMGDLSPHQAALKWILRNTGVAATIPSMVTYGQLEENIGAMGSKMGWIDRKTLHRYGRLIDKTLCRMCDDCLGECPKNVDILDVNRCLMYAEGYDDFNLASATYHRIAASQKPDACLDCRRCVVRCRYGLNIHYNMKRALRTFV